MYNINFNNNSKINNIKNNNVHSNKNIRVKITDPRIIKETGGIVQGMSGTPLMQDGKLVGAINCVSASNPQDGFAIFIDKLI